MRLRHHHTTIRFFTARTVATLFAWITLLPLPPAAWAQEQEVLIGFAGPIKEANARSGRDAAQLAITEANRRDVRIGGKKITFRLIDQDDKADPQTAVFVANFFAKAVPRVTAVIGHSNSGASIATAKIYNDAGIAQISPTAWSNKFTDPGHDTVFQMLGDDENGISNTIDHAMNIMQLRRFAVIDDGAILGNSMADIFVRLATAKGAAIVYRDSISNKTFDFNATLNRAKNSGVDMIFFTGRDTQSDQLVRNMVRLKVPAKLLVTDSVITQKFLQSAGTLPDDYVFAIIPSEPLGNVSGARNFAKAYQAAYGEPFSLDAMQSYDSTNFLIAAIRKANSLEPRAIIDALHALEIPGVSGTLAFDARGRRRNPVYTLYTVRQQQWEAIKFFKNPR